MQPDERLKLIETRLQTAFSPRKLAVIDDSEKHRGHVGSQGGAGHYRIIISADCFVTLSRVTAHREIYALFTDLIPHEIHALQIKIE